MKPSKTTEIMSETAEIVPKTNEIPKKERYSPIKNPTSRHEIVKTLIENTNLSQAEIAKQLNYSPEYVRELKKKLSKTTILTDKIKRLAKNRLTEILNREPAVIEKITREGEVVELKDYPSHGNVLEAIKTVVDRSEPAVQKHDVGVTVELGERLERAMARRIEGNLDNV